MIVAHSKHSIPTPNALQMTRKVYIKCTADGTPNLLPGLALAEFLEHDSQGKGREEGGAMARLIVSSAPTIILFCHYMSFMQLGLIKEIIVGN